MLRSAVIYGKWAVLEFQMEQCKVCCVDRVIRINCLLYFIKRWTHQLSRVWCVCVRLLAKCSAGAGTDNFNTKKKKEKKTQRTLTRLGWRTWAKNADSTEMVMSLPQYVCGTRKLYIKLSTKLNKRRNWKCYCFNTISCCFRSLLKNYTEMVYHRVALSPIIYTLNSLKFLLFRCSFSLLLDCCCCIGFRWLWGHKLWQLSKWNTVWSIERIQLGRLSTTNMCFCHSDKSFRLLSCVHSEWNHIFRFNILDSIAR